MEEHEKLLDCGKSSLRNEVFMKAGRNTVAVEQHVCHKAGSMNDDDDASACAHSDDFMVESRIYVFHDVKAMLGHKKDIKVLAILGPGQALRRRS